MRQISRLQFFGTRCFRGADFIAVVGNGGISPEDNEIINSADCVVRFNNYATRKGIEYTADRFRCDLLVSTFDLHSEHASPTDVLIAIPFPFKAESIIRKIDKWYPRSVPYMVNPYLNMLCCTDLGFEGTGHSHPIPSVGMTLLWHLFQLMKRTPGFNPDVFVAGFNWYSNKDNLTIQDRDIKLPRAGHFNHHYREEMQWILRNLWNHSRFSWSKSCYEILDAFEPHLK